MRWPRKARASALVPLRFGAPARVQVARGAAWRGRAEEEGLARSIKRRGELYEWFCDVTEETIDVATYLFQISCYV